MLARGGRAFPEGRGMWLISDEALDLQGDFIRYLSPEYILVDLARMTRSDGASLSHEEIPKCC
jgi:hypothetical protein